MTRTSASSSHRSHGNAAATATLCMVAVATGLSMAVSGCATPSHRDTRGLPVDVPAAWSDTQAATDTAASSLVAWWTRFDDPPLAQLVSQALRSNTSVASAQAALRQARALRDVAAAALSPSLGSSAQAQRSRRSSSAGAAGSSNLFQAGLDANWELDVFGANRSALDASEATARASAASLGDVQVSIAAEVALGYITLRSTQARLGIAEANLASQQETLQISQWRRQAGLVTSLDVEQARALAEQTSAQLPALQTGIEQTQHALSVLTGQPPAALSAWLRSAAAVPQARDDLALSVPAETLRQRADVRAAEHRVATAAAQVSQAEAARLPSFSIGGSLGLSALTLGALTNGSSVVGTVLGSVTLPLFDGGALRAQVSVQEAALDQARESYRAAILSALADVEDAMAALRGDRVRLTHLAEAADAATNAAALARQQYAGGLVDFQTVLGTQRTQLSTQDSLAGALADVSSDHVRLYKALGGGWAPDTETASIHRAPTP